MSSTTHKIVGMYWRKPALGILKGLPAATQLSVIHDETNEHDPNAMAVFVETATMLRALNTDALKEKMDEEVAQFGTSLSELETQPAWQLGFIPREDAVEVVKDKDKISFSELSFLADGKPVVKIHYHS